VREESLTVIAELGVQIRTKYFNGKEITFFIEKEHVEDVLMHEVRVRVRVRVRKRSISTVSSFTVVHSP